MSIGEIRAIAARRKAWIWPVQSSALSKKPRSEITAGPQVDFNFQNVSANLSVVLFQVVPLK